MTRKKHKKKQQAWTLTPSCFVFTPETVSIAQTALSIFEQALPSKAGQSSRVAFAQELLRGLKSKLEAMQASVGQMVLTTFDYNEKQVLMAALQMYRIHLSESHQTERTRRKDQHCQQMIAFFQGSLAASDVAAKHMRCANEGEGPDTGMSAATGP